MDFIKIVLDIMGYAASLTLIITFIWGVCAWIKGILPALLRLGNGLARRKIAVFAKGDNLKSLINLLLDTKLFNKKNIIEIPTLNDFGRAERATLFLVFWHDWKENIENLLSIKKNDTALIVYAPRESGDIPSESLKRISDLRYTTVTNFRGRLLNDIVISMITTSYD